MCEIIRMFGIADGRVRGYRAVADILLGIPARGQTIDLLDRLPAVRRSADAITYSGSGSPLWISSHVQFRHGVDHQVRW